MKTTNLNKLNDLNNLNDLIDDLIHFVFLRMCQRRFDANMYAYIIDVNDDYVFLLKRAK